jgi:hypothetical protein
VEVEKQELALEQDLARWDKSEKGRTGSSMTTLE